MDKKYQINQLIISFTYDKRNSQTEHKRFNIDTKSSHRYNVNDTKTRQTDNSLLKKKVSYAIDDGNSYDLADSNQTLKYDDKITPNRTERVSKICRFSKYIDFLQTPLSTLERSLSKKKGSDAVKNDKKEDEILTSAQDNQRGSVGKDNGTSYLTIS